jgi:toxin ParE1/3/4
VRLRYTGPALADLNSILDYITEQSPRTAIRVQARIRAIIELVRNHPAISERTSDPDIRRMPVTPYRYLVFYEVGDDEIIVHAVRHGARDRSDSPGSG